MHSTTKPFSQGNDIVITVPTARLTGLAHRDWLKQKPNSDIATRRHHVTFFKNASATTLKVGSMTLLEIRALVLETKAATKANLPWLKLAHFGLKKTEKGCLRTDDNIVEITGIELDYDQGMLGFDAAVAVLEAMNVRALIYTSPSNTSAAPRWRILLPLSRNLSPEIRGKLCARMNGKFNGIFALESFTLSQAYYYGRAADNAAPAHRAKIIDGRMIDLCDELYKFEKAGWPKAEEDELHTAGNAQFTSAARGFAEHLARIGDGENLDGFNYPLIKATAAYAHANGAGLDREELKGLLRAAINAAPKKKTRKPADIARFLSDKYLDGIIESAIRKFAALSRGVWRERDAKGNPKPSLHNARLAITALGIECSYDTFHNVMLFGFTGENFRHALGDEADDHALVRLRQIMSDRFGFDFLETNIREAVIGLALEHCFDPVCDMLDEAEGNWDGVERLDRMAVDYFNAEDTPLNRACVRKTMIAAVRRARKPGCKFDNMLILESIEGWMKSTAFRVLAGDDNFSDQPILSKGGREVQEQLCSIWIHENAELAGMNKADAQHLKSFTSRQVDIARPAYGHLPKKQKRHSIEVGSTNDEQYLQSQTGNRRIWPLKVLRTIDIEKLQRDRLQLWGEAAKLEAAGESLVIPETLWPAAAAAQEQRRITDPWEDRIANLPATVVYKNPVTEREEPKQIIFIEGEKECVASADLLTYVLRVPVGQQKTSDAMRLANVMKQAGWEKPANKISVDGKQVRGYWRAVTF